MDSEINNEVTIARPGLGTQPRYEAPGELRVKNVKRSD